MASLTSVTLFDIGQGADTNLTQKYGRPNEATPAKWQQDYTDFNAPLENGVAAQPKAETTSKKDVLDAPPIPPNATTAVAVEIAAAAAAAQPPKENRDSKKRKRHDDETPEQKAERKRKKKEKKEKRKSKQVESDDDSE